MHHPLACLVGWILLHSLWQGALIGAAFALIRSTLKQCSPNARYVAGCAALALMLALPVIAVLSRSNILNQGAAGIFASDSVSGASLSAFSASDTGNSFAGNGIHSLIEWLANFLGMIAPWLVPLWFFGVILLTARLTRSWWWIRTLRVKNNELIDAAWLEVFADLCCRLEIARPVRLLKSALVEVPTVIGWLHPVILLPASTFIGLTPAQLEAILAHELAHVRRLDYLVNTFQCIVETLMFYHPVVWWISRCVREERENCCDDLVVKVCGDRLTYARALATLEESRADIPQLTFAASGGSLLNRIRRLLGAPTDEAPVSFRHLSGLTLFALGIVLIALGVYLSLRPAAYEAMTRLRLEPNAPAQLSSNDGKLTLNSYDPYYIQTEFGVIQSEQVLGKVVEDLGLRTKWEGRFNAGAPLKTQEAVDLLRSRLDLRPIRNTTFLEIRVYSDKPDEAASLANAVAAAYKNFSQDQHKQLYAGGIKAVEDRLADQEGRICKASDELEKLRQELHVPDSLTLESASSPLMSAETLRHIEQMRLETQTELWRQETLLKQLRSLSRPELIQVLPRTSSQDTLLTSLLEQQNITDQGLALRKKEFGDNHPDVIKLVAQSKELKTRIDQSVDGILFALEARVSSLRENLSNLEKEVDKATKADIERARTTRPYYAKARELDELTRFRQVLSMKIASEQIDQNLPKSSAVQIIDPAFVPLRPSSPDRTRAGALILLGFLLDVTGIFLLKHRPVSA
jgi:beta-lactamase regulating signal transducer with metallopeptidase domain/uncharacterized protein involved in exopolysaccharide biosynthesis